MDKKELEEILKKQELGTASREELDLLEKFANDLIVKNKETVFKSDIEKYEIKKALRKRIEIKASEKYKWFRMVASIALILGLSISYWFTKDSLFGTEMILVSTGVGEHKTVILPDGSEVSLNSKSEIEYPIAFSESARNVSLTGEAIFNVKKDASRPFKVFSNSVSTTVLGTVFNVNAYLEDSIVNVSLLEGSVRIDQNDNSMLLKPTEQAIFMVNENSLLKTEFNPATILAWQNKDIVLSKTSFTSIKNIIARNFGVNIQFEHQEINQFTVSGTFNQPDLKTFIATVCAAKSLNYKQIEDNTILISKQ